MSGKVQVKWNPENYKIRSRSVEQQLEPLIVQVTTLMKHEKSNKTQKGRGKARKAAALIVTLEKSIEHFIRKGEEIAHENQDLENDMLEAVDEIRNTGDIMCMAARDFLNDPFNSEKRSEMIKSARTLLAAVARLLILADMVDVQFLVNAIIPVRAYLEKLKTVPDSQLLENLKEYEKVTNTLLQRSAIRQHEIVDPHIRDDMAAARAVLKKSSTMLLTATKTYLSHSHVPAARANKDEMLKQICEAVDVINDTAQGKTPKSGSGKFAEAGKLASNFETFENRIIYEKVQNRQILEQQLEELVNGATLICDSGSLKNERREKIIAGCSALREALQNLISHSMQQSDDSQLSKAAEDVTKKSKILRRNLQKGIADKISDSFLSGSPLGALVAAAQQGKVQEVETCAAMFTEHCNKLIEVTTQVCYLSNNEEGIKMVRYAASQLFPRCQGVINAARVLAMNPESEIARQNLGEFKEEWENQVKILLEAVDDIATIDDVLSVLDSNIFEEMNRYIAAVEERNPILIATLANQLRARAERISQLVSNEMDDYEPCLYTKKVLEALKVLNQDIITDFNEKTEKIIEIIENNPDQEIDENEFIDATRLVYDGVRDLRRAVLMNRADEDLDPEEVEFEETYITETITKEINETSEVVEEDSQNMGPITVARQAMGNLPEKEKSKIMEQVASFKTEQITFDKEVAKWDESGNDIVVLAKYMCMIMIQMTDFVRQRGDLKTTTDVINAAKKISETGTKLDSLARQIANQCPESATKKDLLTYLERVTLYCHQINIISKVKADVQNCDEDELILAGVESATSLIENAKNLMNAVVLTVKASYVASTKYNRKAFIASPIVVWKMKVPEKKPLVRIQKPKEVKAVVRKATQKRTENPLKALAEFQSV